MQELILQFIPTPEQRKENKYKNKRREDLIKNNEQRKFEISSSRKVRFGSLDLIFTHPKKDKTTKTFIVYIDKPLPWEVIVKQVTKALEEFL